MECDRSELHRQATGSARHVPRHVCGPPQGHLQPVVEKVVVPLMSQPHSMLGVLYMGVYKTAIITTTSPRNHNNGRGGEAATRRAGGRRKQQSWQPLAYLQ
eukprot:3957262-Pyramimonas_sp.AAC.1